MKKYKLILESSSDGIWSRSEIEGSLVTTYGKNLEEVKTGFLEALDLLKKTTNQIPDNPAEIEFEFQVDLESFFEMNDYINISRLADHIGINKSLLRQYAKGIKYPSLEQTLKIEEALKNIATNLLSSKLLNNPVPLQK